jgi:hypothetical protein
VRAKANGGYADGSSGVTGTTIDQWTTHAALMI